MSKLVALFLVAFSLQMVQQAPRIDLLNKKGKGPGHKLKKILSKLVSNCGIPAKDSKKVKTTEKNEKSANSTSLLAKPSPVRAVQFSEPAFKVAEARRYTSPVRNAEHGTPMTTLPLAYGQERGPVYTHVPQSDQQGQNYLTPTPRRGSAELNPFFEPQEPRVRAGRVDEVEMQPLRSSRDQIPDTGSSRISNSGKRGASFVILGMSLCLILTLFGFIIASLIRSRK